MHWIQRHILIELTTHEFAKYTDLIPEGVEGNLFSYHLKQLISARLAGKVDDGYSLTSLGKRKVATMSLTSSKDIPQPRVFSMVYVENETSQVCLFKWSRQPYLGHISLPFNRVVYGTSIVEAAVEALQYKTGLLGKVEYAGTVDVIVNKQGNPSTHYIAHLFRAKYTLKAPISDKMTGEPFWGNISDYTGQELVYGTDKIIKFLNTKKSPFFEEILIEK